ncbi:MAG: RIP metalloprotease RseP [Sphaerochaetaceae bacterium]
MSSLFSIVIGIMSIAIMVGIHETGHFVFARLMGIEVHTFAIGFGKAIKKWQKGKTVYRLNIFPLGGYCQLKGADELQKRLDGKIDEHAPSEKGSLFSVSPWRRIGVYGAGSLFNFLFALLILIVFYLLPYEAVSYPNKIVLSSDYPSLFGVEEGDYHLARDGGLLSGDVVIAIGEHHVTTFSDIQEALSHYKGGQTIDFTVLRNNKQHIYTLSTPKDKPLHLGLSYYMAPIIGFVAPLSAEQRALLLPNDRIIALFGQEVNNTFDVLQLLSDNPQVIELTILRGQQELAITYVPDRLDSGELAIGFSFLHQSEQKKGLGLTAVPSALKEAVSTFGSTFALIPRLFSGSIPFKDAVAGPIRISYVIGQMRNASVRAALHLLALVSLSLAAANLLPIPGLDGGSILLSLLELIRGKNVSPRFFVRFQSVGLAFLAVLMLLVLAQDIGFLFSGF